MESGEGRQQIYASSIVNGILKDASLSSSFLHPDINGNRGKYLQQVDIIRNLDPQTNIYLLQTVLSQLSYESDNPRDQDRRETALGILQVMNFDSLSDRDNEIYAIYTQILAKVRKNPPETPYGSVESLLLAGNQLAGAFPPRYANQLEFEWYVVADSFENQDDRAFIVDQSSAIAEEMEEGSPSLTEDHSLNERIKILYEQEPARAYRILRENYGMNNFAEIGRLLGKTRGRVSYEIGIYDYTPRRPLRS
ncbi:MAG TPA: hypothetical protein VLF89_07275 [Candidatus Saccharimonadales bacterium]|nr:hypothetical protein [Candidatus Saccharimonadales bacterium]